MFEMTRFDSFMVCFGIPATIGAAIISIPGYFIANHYYHKGVEQAKPVHARIIESSSTNRALAIQSKNGLQTILYPSLTNSQVFVPIEEKYLPLIKAEIEIAK